MNVQQLNDKELILNYLDGNDKAFEVLLNRHRNKIYTSIYLFVIGCGGVDGWPNAGYWISLAVLSYT